MNSDKGHIYETNVRCNLCGGIDHTILARHTNEAAAALRETHGCRFVECTGCGLRFYDPRVEESYAIRTWLEGNRAEAEAISMATTGVFFGDPPAGSAEAQLATLKSYYSGIWDHIVSEAMRHSDRYPRALFEVGASVGHFSRAACDRANELGKNLAAAGCDANPFSAKLAREINRVEIRGCTVRSYKIEPSQLNAYDAIVAYDFLEHTYTPRDDLEKLLTLASPGGLIAIKTFVDDHDPEGTMVHPLFHHHHFTLKTLRAIIEKAGWNILLFDDEAERCYAQVTVFAQKAA